MYLESHTLGIAIFWTLVQYSTGILGMDHV